MIEQLLCNLRGKARRVFFLGEIYLSITKGSCLFHKCVEVYNCNKYLIFA